MRNSNLISIIVTFFICILTFTIGNRADVLNAATIEELQSKIKDASSNIQNLEKEIAQYQAQVQQVNKQANTLANTIKSLDLSRKKLEADTALTVEKIKRTNLQIAELGSDISEKQVNINDNKNVIANALRAVNIQEETSTIESLLSGETLSSFWDDIDNITRLQSRVRSQITSLKQIKAGLETNKVQTEKKKAELVTLTKQLETQRAAVLSTTKQKQTVLTETKSLEANYRSLVAVKQAQKEAFERELFAFESQLKIAIDPSSIPTSGKGVIQWPFSSVRVTQYFGNTAFATANAQIYNGKGHTGIDLGAPVGTPTKAALSGVITGVGNTDAYPGCWSYGKWVFIKHANGLSTLYAHLSVISVTEGQTVATGEVIGYSGNTGYSTGPHLHFGVYATQGVRIQKFESSINCKGATIPLADPKAYLNPLSYL